MLRALIFDFDGLLVDTETALIDAWLDIHAEDGVPCDRAHMHAIVGHVDRPHDAWIHYPATADRAALEQRYRARARRLTLDAPLRPGVEPLLARAAAAGLRLAVASNSTHPHVEGHLAHRRLLDRFDAVVCREDVARGKPEPDVYLAALAALGLTAADAVAFEDSPPGHLAAHRAGLRVVVVPNPSTAHGAFPHAWLRLESLESLALETLQPSPAPTIACP